MTRAAAETGPAWLEIAVEVAGIDGELVADVLRQACSGGVAIEPAHRLDREIDAYVVDGDASAVVRGYLPAGGDSVRARRSLRLALAMAPVQSPARWRRARRLLAVDWRDSWKKHFGVQRIGRALIIKPSWVEYARRPGDTVIEIDPGMAFGTGQHQTTAMCLRAVEELMRPGAAALDLGCGTGILAIAAAKLGASRVVALDIDGQAVKAAQENAAANGEGRIDVRAGSLEEESGVFDVLVANISALALERMAARMAAALSPGGVLIASGFLDDAVERLSLAFRSVGLTIDRVVDEGVWRCLIARKPARP